MKRFLYLFHENLCFEDLSYKCPSSRDVTKPSSCADQNSKKAKTVKRCNGVELDGRPFHVSFLNVTHNLLLKSTTLPVRRTVLKFKRAASTIPSF